MLPIRKIRWFRRIRLAWLTAQLLCAAEDHGHSAYCELGWPSRIAGARERYTCRKCGAQAWMDYSPPGGMSHVRGPLVEYHCIRS